MDTLTVSSATGHSQVRSKTVEEYASTDEIVADMDTLMHENFILSQTAEVLERYLRKRSPTLILGMEKFVEMMSHCTRGSMQVSGGRTPSMSSSKSSPAETGLRSSTASSVTHGWVSRSNAQSGGSYKVSSAAKADIVERELEENRMTIEKLQRRFASAKFLLETEEENMRIDIQFLDQGRIELDDFLSRSIDIKSGKISLDKFLRFLERELQANDRYIRKVRLKSKSLQTEYRRLLAQQQQRMELRERLHPIDIEKLIIENEEELDILEQKNKELQNLKKMVGRKGQNVVSVKSKLNDTIFSLKSLKQDLEQRKFKCKFIDEQKDKNHNQLTIAEQINQDIKKLNTTFKSPDVHSYLLVQSKLQELKSEKKKWEWRCNYQHQQISLLEHQVKQLSSSPRLRGFSGGSSPRKSRYHSTSGSRKHPNTLPFC